MDFEKEANEAFNYVCGTADACGVFKKGDDLSRKNCECRYNIEQVIRRAYAQGIEDAAKACEKVQRDFLSSRYAFGQPMASFSERFACGECITLIRSLNKDVRRDPTREEARALTDAGYMSVSEYVRLFGEK